MEERNKEQATTDAAPAGTASTQAKSGGEGAPGAPLVDAQKRERCWAARGNLIPPPQSQTHHLRPRATSVCACACVCGMAGVLMRCHT
jgi:hypothetical protein